jgi:hypothetical protein
MSRSAEGRPTAPDTTPGTRRPWPALDPHGDSAAREVAALLDSLGSDALRAKAGRMLDNRHTEALNGFGDAGVYVPWTSNPALGQVGAREVKVGRWWHEVVSGASQPGERIVYRTKTGETKTAPANSEVRDR